MSTMQVVAHHADEAAGQVDRDIVVPYGRPAGKHKLNRYFS